MDAALGRGMDQILFGLKRAYQKSAQACGELIADTGLTPARFDLMFALKQARDELLNMMTQRKLRDVLGVSAPTVSRMLRSLEALGLVWRGPKRRRWDRSRDVMLTKRGRWVLRRAAKRAYFNYRTRRLLYRALRGRRSREMDFMIREDFDYSLDTVRSFFKDRATLYYPWHPDE